MNRILVTGGAGVIGSWVTRQLVKKNFHTTVLDMREDYTLLGSQTAEKIDYITGDLSQAGLIEQVVDRGRFDAIVHLAAAVGHKAVDPDPKSTFDLNLGTTMRLLEAARLANVGRFIFASSRCVYGEISGPFAHPTYAPITEDHPLRGATLYDTTKIASEGLGRAFAARYDMNFAALRFGTIYGPGKTVRHKSFGVLSNIVELPAQGETVHVARGGDQQDDIIYVEDAAAGIVATLQAPALNHSEYNISSGRLVTLSQLRDAVHEHFPLAKIEIDGGLNYFGDGNPNYSGLMANDRAVTELGFQPETRLEVNVDRYYRAMRDLGLVNENQPSRGK